MSEFSESSQTDIFADTQVPERNNYVSEANPDEWIEADFTYPRLILFCWGGQSEPFILTPLVELHPSDINMKWLTGLLSPLSRRKHRNFRNFQDFSASIFGKIHKCELNYVT